MWTLFIVVLGKCQSLVSLHSSLRGVCVWRGRGGVVGMEGGRISGEEEVVRNRVSSIFSPLHWDR